MLVPPTPANDFSTGVMGLIMPGLVAQVVAAPVSSPR